MIKYSNIENISALNSKYQTILYFDGVFSFSHKSVQLLTQK